MGCWGVLSCELGLSWLAVNLLGGVVLRAGAVVEGVVALDDLSDVVGEGALGAGMVGRVGSVRGCWAQGRDAGGAPEDLPYGLHPVLDCEAGVVSSGRAREEGGDRPSLVGQLDHEVSDHGQLDVCDVEAGVVDGDPAVGFGLCGAPGCLGRRPRAGPGCPGRRLRASPGCRGGPVGPGVRSRGWRACGRP